MMIDLPPSEVREHPDSASAPHDAERDSKANDEISVLDLLIVLAERKRLILGVTAVSAILALVVSLLLPAKYTASVTLLTPQQNTSMGAALASQMGSMGGMAALSLGLKNPNDVFVGMFRSRTVEDAMIQRFDLMKEYRARNLVDARKTFENAADVDGDGKDKMIHISVVDRDPKRAAEMANAYVEEFQRLSGHLAITEASQRRLFFQRELEEAKDNLANAEEALKRTELTTGVIQLDSQARALIESAAALRAQIIMREVQIKGMQTYLTGENSQLVQAQQEVASLRAQLAKLGGSADNGDSELLVPKNRVPEAGLEYVRKVRDVKYYETIFDILARQFEIAKLDEAKEGAVIQIVDSAVQPDKRSAPKRGAIVIGATFIGMLLGIFWALISAGMEYLRSEPAANAKLLHFKRVLSWRARPASRVV